MAEKDITLAIKSGKTSYELPTSAIDTKAVLQQLGATDASQVPFTITITREKSVKVNGATVIGTTSGTGNGKFDPDGLVTREQMATFLVKTMDYYDKAIHPQPPHPRQGKFEPG